MVAAAATEAVSATELGIHGSFPSSSSTQFQNGISSKPISISAQKFDLSCNSEKTTLPISNGENPPTEAISATELEIHECGGSYSSSIQFQNGISTKPISISSQKFDLSSNSEKTTLPISNGENPPSEAISATELKIHECGSPYSSSIQFQNGISTKPISISSQKFDLSCNSEKTINSQNPPSSNVQVELASLESTSYTSLRDILPVQSPPSQSYYEIPIKNRLVQLAAWAYLQPMSNSSENRDGNFFRRLCVSFPVNCLNNQLEGCFEFMNEDVFSMIRRAIGGILRKISGERNGEERIGI